MEVFIAVITISNIKKIHVKIKILFQQCQQLLTFHASATKMLQTLKQICNFQVQVSSSLRGL